MPATTTTASSAFARPGAHSRQPLPTRSIPGNTHIVSARPRSQLVWHESLSLGIPDIDAHHQYLAALINRFAECGDGPAGRPRAFRILMELAHYATYHFEYEERLMKEYGYPGAEEHHGGHLQFCEVVAEASYGATLGIIGVDDLHDYLCRWWDRHVRQEDMHFRDFLAATAAGISPRPAR